MCMHMQDRVARWLCVQLGKFCSINYILLA